MYSEVSKYGMYLYKTKEKFFLSQNKGLPTTKSAVYIYHACMQDMYIYLFSAEGCTNIFSLKQPRPDLALNRLWDRSRKFCATAWHLVITVKYHRVEE
jgi:hypothetical protein